MKVIIAGSRDITDPDAVDAAVKASGFEITEVITGGARGVDALGRQWANRHQLPHSLVPANWDTYGKRAGIMRNRLMAGMVAALVAVWDGESKGTKHMIEEARRKGLKVYVHLVKD